VKISPKKVEVRLVEMSQADFLALYNKNIPPQFPRATAVLLDKFKEDHLSLFKHGNLWSLDQHRKKIMDWLPLNLASSN
jgi:hypothetical protein